MRYSTLINIIFFFTLSCVSPAFHDKEELDKSFLVLDVNSLRNWGAYRITIDGVTHRNPIIYKGEKFYLPIYPGHRKIHICLMGWVSLKPLDGSYENSACKEELDNLLIFPNYGGYYRIEKQSVYIIKSIPLEDSYTWKSPTLSIETVLDTIFLPLWPIGWLVGFSPKYTQLYAYELVPERVILGDDAKRNLDNLGIVEDDFTLNLKVNKRNFVEPRSIYYISDNKNKLISKAIPILEFSKIEFDKKMEPIVIGLEIIYGETKIEKGSKIWASK